jgi:beta-lactamase superfamily II metal-dependent hydrolase
MFFKYSPGEIPETYRPRSVFARIDSLEPGDAAAEEPPTVLLDCIDAQWLAEDAHRDTPLWMIEEEDADRRISIIEISGDQFGIYRDQEVEGDWWHLELDDSGQGDPALQYFNLFSDPTPRGVVSRRKLNPDEQALVEAAAGWRGIAPSPPDSLVVALRGVQDPDGVAIYDVGQGSCNALLRDGVPILYFDFGGSAIGNWRSFPLHLKNFCFTYQPPIVLSHWDWDHWSSALRDLRALQATWILPIQSQARSLGAVHARFIAMLRRNRATLLWCDQQTPCLPTSGFEICFCNGPGTNRNESGLALTLGHGPIRVLLPADASPGNALHCGCEVDHLVVPHHGGRTDLSGLPNPTNVKSSHLIYSYGVGNIFLHPLTDMRRRIRKTWKKNIHTALRDRTGFGHVGIDLAGRYAKKPQPPCGGACQLSITQWI